MSNSRSCARGVGSSVRSYFPTSKRYVLRDRDLCPNNAARISSANLVLSRSV
jgi:hypothetical protein